MNRIRTPLVVQGSGVSSAIRRENISIRAGDLPSGGGRDQFSVENELDRQLEYAELGGVAQPVS